MKVIQYFCPLDVSDWAIKLSRDQNVCVESLLLESKRKSHLLSCIQLLVEINLQTDKIRLYSESVYLFQMVKPHFGPLPD